MRRPIFALLVALAGLLVPSVVAQVPRLVPVTLPVDQQLSGPRAVALSPDGTRFVYAANNRLYLKTVSDAPPTMIPGTEVAQGPGVTNPVFSPDGRSIAFWSAADQTVKRIALTGGTPTTIAPADNPVGMNWGSDDEILLGAGPKGVLRVATSGGMPDTIVTLNDGTFAATPERLPDTGAVLFTVLDPRAAGAAGWDAAKIVVQLPGSGARKTIIDGGAGAHFVPTGHLLFGRAGALMAVAFDVTRRETVGRPISMADDVRVGGFAGPGQFSVSRSGTLIYQTGRRGQVQAALVSRDGKRQPIGLLPDSVFAPRLSPDGKQLALDIEGGIWVADRSNLSAMRPVVPFGGPNAANQFPIWSGDGQQIIFTSIRNGTQALYWLRADGTGEPELLVSPARSPESWSATNQLLSYITMKGDADYDIWSYSLRDKTVKSLIEAPTTAQSSSWFSHDGRLVAYQSNETGKFEIFVQPVPTTGAKFQITSDGGTLPMWSADDRELFYANGGRLFAVPVQTQPTQGTVTAGTPIALPITDFIQQGSVFARRQYDLTPDGKQFLMMFRVAPRLDVVSNWPEELKRRVTAQ